MQKFPTRRTIAENNHRFGLLQGPPGNGCCVPKFKTIPPLKISSPKVRIKKRGLASVRSGGKIQEAERERGMRGPSDGERCA